MLGLARTLLVAIILVGAPAGAHAQKPLDKVTLTLQWLTQCQFAGYYVALEKGYYRAEGIDLTIRPGSSDTNPVQMVTVGVAQFGTRWFADLVKAVDGGAPVLSVAQIFGSSGLVLVTRADSGIRHPRDFVGKRVGIWFFGNEVQFYALMQQTGVDIGKVKVSPLHASLQPFLSRELDVINTTTYNELPTLLRSVKRSEIRIFDFTEFGLDFPGDVLFTSRALLKERPDLARRMVRASLRGWADALKDPEGAVRIVLKRDRGGTLDPEHQGFQMADVARLVAAGNRALGAHSPQDVDRVVGMLAKNKLISRTLPHADIYTNDLLR